MQRYLLRGAGGNWATVGRKSRGGRRVHRQREKRKGKSVGLRIGTLNVGTMTGKGRELADMMERRKVNILCVQETRWKGSKARSIGARFKLFYYGVDSKRNGVGVVLKEEFVRNVLEDKRVSDRVMSLKLEIEGVMLNVVSGYAPQVGCELEEKERFWSELDEVMESIPAGERVVIGTDFNGHVGEGNRGDEEVMGKFGVKERNLEGQMVVDFAKRMDMAVVNTYFQKREEHRVTYKSGVLEKAYDRVPREELWYCIRKSGVAEKYVRVVQDMYERSRTVVRCAVGQTEEFNVEVGLHQGSALSPFLFAIVMDQLSEEVRQESPCTMMFADDIVICSESREQVEENLERWRFALERRGMKVSHCKTMCMCVNEREGSGTVRLQGVVVKNVQGFKYLGSTVHSNGECGKEVKKRVQAGWNGWRKVSGVLCDRKISARIKWKVYRTVVRPAMLYVSLRKRQESELEVAELKKLSISCDTLGGESWSALDSALRSETSNLRELHLTVKTLNLSCNNLGDSEVKSLSAVLENPHCKVEILDLSRNNLGDSGVKSLSAVLANPHCKVKTLGLSKCGVSGKGCAALTSALRSNPSHLRYLNLSENNVGDSGVKSVSAVLENPHCKLETLKRYATNLYKDLYKTDYRNNKELLDTFCRVLPKVSPEDNTALEGSLVLEELQDALNSMAEGKAPGIDGPYQWSSTSSFGGSSEKICW
ncbi:hypothetical protein QTP70_001065, partial [Hemibagrus guttatus]